MERATLTANVYEKLRQMILEGDLDAGQRLNEKELSSTLGVSPTPVREAINKLRGDGLAVYSPWHGARVRHLTLLDIGHLHNIRCALEGMAAREAALELSPADIDELERLVQDGFNADGARRLHQLNERFHRFFREHSHNPWLDQMLGGINDLLVFARLPLAATATGSDAWHEHAAVVAELRRGDGLAAEAAMVRHIRRVNDDLVTRLRNSREQSGGE